MGRRVDIPEGSAMDAEHPDLYNIIIRPDPGYIYSTMADNGGRSVEEAVRRATTRYPGKPFTVVRYAYEWCGYMWEDIATGIAYDPCYEP